MEMMTNVEQKPALDLRVHFAMTSKNESWYYSRGTKKIAAWDP
jgi:hypothetical protein